MNDVTFVQNCVTRQNDKLTNFIAILTINKHNMKKSIFFAIVMIFAMSSSMAFAGNKNLNSDGGKTTVPVQTENKVNQAEIDRLTKRVEEIRDMDKTGMNASERLELRKELRETKKNVKRAGGTIYIGGATLILIIILIILLV